MENTEYKLTYKLSHSKKFPDGKKRNKLYFFLNGILILEQKAPFDEDFDFGYQYQTRIYDIYLKGNNIYQKRKNMSSPPWRTNKLCIDSKERIVKYPVSKKALSIFNIPKDMVIKIDNS